jgi:hypothetical protein
MFRLCRKGQAVGLTRRTASGALSTQGRWRDSELGLTRFTQTDYDITTLRRHFDVSANPPLFSRDGRGGGFWRQCDG